MASRIAVDVQKCEGLKMMLFEANLALAFCVGMVGAT